MTKTESSASCLPIGVFWDIENCCVPKWKSALLVVKAIREKFFNGHREVEFMCVCDTSKESRHVIQELNQAQVNVVHIDAISKNAADDKLRQNIRRFCDTHDPPARVVLISSDVNFSPDLYDLRYRKKFDIILIHSHQIHDSLLHCASECFLYEDIVKDIPPRTPSKPLDGEIELVITGYNETLDTKKVRSKLQKLSSNTGGKVICVTDKYALVRFKSNSDAERARHRMDGHEFYGNTIHVDYSTPAQYTQTDTSNYNNNYDSRGILDSRKNVSPNRARPYSQSYRKNSPPKSRPHYNQHPLDNVENSNSASNLGNKSGEVSPLDALLSGQLETLPVDQSVEEGLQGLVRKFSQENKSSRQVLMLQQQIYQEEQVPLGTESTQFYSQCTKFQETSYYGYGNHWQPQGYHDNRHFIEGYQQPQPYTGYDGNYYQYPNTGPAPPSYPASNLNVPTYRAFRPIRSVSPSDSSASSSPCDFNSAEYPGCVDLLVSNLDYNISPREWKHILTTTFHPHVKILYIDVSLQPDNTSLGLIKVASMEEARFAISQFHRKKIGYKRIHVTLKSDEEVKNVSTVKSEAIALLSEAKDNKLPLFKFIELFNKRFNRSVSVAELYKMNDTIEIREQKGSGRTIYLAPELRKPEGQADKEDGEIINIFRNKGSFGSKKYVRKLSDEVKEIIEQIVCSYHCPEGSKMYTEAVNTTLLPNVKLQLKTFAPQVHSLLMTHDGDMPLLSFPACFSVEVAPLVYVYEGGVPLEHLISCVPGVQIVVSNTGVKRVHWSENKPPSSPDLSRIGQQLAQFSKEMVDLLKSSTHCRMPFSKFIPIYHQHFGRQCRMADYGFTKLQDLFDAVPHIVQVLGTGERKILTLTHRAQVKRFTADLVKLLKSIPGRMLYLSSLTEEFCKLFNMNWDILEYGVCHLDDMLGEVPAGVIEILTEGHDTIIALPRKDQTPEEIERMKQFALEVVDLLKHSHGCRMIFSKFIPAYHHHFGHQCKVSDYGFTKLQDLFEALPKVVELIDEGEEKIIRLTEPELRKVIGELIVNLLKQRKVQCYPLDKLMSAFSQEYGYPLPLDDLHVSTVEELMTKLKHALKVEMYDGKDYVVLSDRTSAPPLARQVLQLLMDQSGGSLPLMELCSRYKTTFGIDPDVKKIKEELLDYVQISGDEESGVISLTPLEALARDIRALLQKHGKMTLAHFERLFFEHHSVEIKPALYGFPTTVALLLAIPHVISIKGKGSRRMVHLSGDLQGSLPIIDESYTRPDSDTPSNDSGSALTDEDSPIEQKKFLPIDLLGGAVPSNVPSPTLRPDQYCIDLMKFETFSPDVRDSIFSSITDEERLQQQSPLCQTPTSQLLQLAAQFLPTPPNTPTEEWNPKMDNGGKPVTANEPKDKSSSDIIDLIKNDWWRASPCQLQEVSESIRNAGLVEKIASIELDTNLTSAEKDLVKIVAAGSALEEEHIKSKAEGRVSEKLVITNKGTEHDTDADSRVIEITPETVEVRHCTDKNNNDKGKSEKPKARASDSDYRGAINSLSATISYLKEQSKEQEKMMQKAKNDASEPKRTDDQKVDEPVARCPTALQPGSYWYAKRFQSQISTMSEISSKTVKETTKPTFASVVASTQKQEGMNNLKVEEKEAGKVQVESIKTPHVSIDTSESFSAETITPEVSTENLNKDVDTLAKQELTENEDESEIKDADKEINEFDAFEMELKQTEDYVRSKVNQSRKSDSKPSRTHLEHNIENCVVSDCMCYEVVFRQDQPIETSSVKSDTSFTESCESSPKWNPLASDSSFESSPKPKKVLVRQQHLSSSSVSDESANGSINKRKSRLAARFEQPLE